MAQPIEAVPMAVPMAQAMDREPMDGKAMGRAFHGRPSPMNGLMMEAQSGCYVQQEFPNLYFYLRFNADHSKYSMGPGGCCLIFCCPCSEACGVHEAQDASSGTYQKPGRIDRWDSPTKFVRMTPFGTKETYIKACC